MTREVIPVKGIFYCCISFIFDHLISALNWHLSEVLRPTMPLLLREHPHHIPPQTQPVFSLKDWGRTSWVSLNWLRSLIIRIEKVSSLHIYLTSAGRGSNYLMMISGAWPVPGVSRWPSVDSVGCTGHFWALTPHLFTGQAQHWSAHAYFTISSVAIDIELSDTVTENDFYDSNFSNYIDCPHLYWFLIIWTINRD